MKRHLEARECADNERLLGIMRASRRPRALGEPMLETPSLIADEAGDDHGRSKKIWLIHILTSLI